MGNKRNKMMMTYLLTLQRIQCEQFYKGSMTALKIKPAFIGSEFVINTVAFNLNVQDANGYNFICVDFFSSCNENDSRLKEIIDFLSIKKQENIEL